MKICDNCGSTTFDDMERCYDCMSSFIEPIEDEWTHEKAPARFQIILSGSFCYELLLQKQDGRSLSVGSSDENAIVIPQNHIAPHQFEVFYAHGQVWAASETATPQVSIGEIPLCGTVCIKPGTEIGVGEATITLLEA